MAYFTILKFWVLLDVTNSTCNFDLNIAKNGTCKGVMDHCGEGCLEYRVATDQIWDTEQFKGL